LQARGVLAILGAMLTELAISNLALFEQATLSFGPDLNAITGETGAGKSLLVDALELLLGERPRASPGGAGGAGGGGGGGGVVAGGGGGGAAGAGWCAEHLPAVAEAWSESAAAERELILSRALSAEGRSKAWIDQRPVTARALRELAALLVEVHGQNEHQRLFESAEQAQLLDAFGQHAAKLAAYRVARGSALEALRAAAEFEARARERRDRLDLLRFQQRELAEAQLAPDEHEALLSERETLRHAAQLAEDLAPIAAGLEGDETAALSVLARAERVLERWESRIARLAGPAEELRAARGHLEEAARELGRFCEGLEVSPARLEEVEARLYAVERLEKKYQLDVAGLLAHAAAVAAELERAERVAEDRSLLAQAADAARAELERAAAALTSARRAQRSRLQKEVERRLAGLGLERARFSVQVEPRMATAVDSPNVAAERAQLLALERRFAQDGADQVEFLLAANPGEDVQPLRHVASGGEASRILLALRTALALRQAIPTLVFDEIDSGVGGRLGPAVGAHLRELARTQHQVLCVTHLPAIAALADHHFRVEKRSAAGRTRTEVVELDGEARIAEVADMIAGGRAQPTARAEARRLLGLAEK